MKNKNIATRHRNKDVKNKLSNNAFLIVSLAIFIIFSLIHPEKIPNYYKYVDWQTIITLTALVFVTTGIKNSGFFYNLARMLTTHFKRENILTLFMVVSSALMSMFLTNDIALFIIVPLTLSLKDVPHIDWNKLVVFEAIAVNVGSTMTPIGNPQNIFLWHQWGISFTDFILHMLPLEIIMMVLLICFVFLSFSSQQVDITNLPPPKKVRRKLLATSLVLLICYLVSTEFDLSFYALTGIFAIYCLTFTDILSDIDWPLIILFVVMFIDLHLITDLSIVKSFFHSINLNKNFNLYLSGIITSQFISNVPAALLLSKFSQNWKLISYGVNIGGNGIVIGSMANIIALRLANNSNVWKTFHRYSIPFLIISGIAVWCWIAYVPGGPI